MMMRSAPRMDNEAAPDAATEQRKLHRFVYTNPRLWRSLRGIGDTTGSMAARPQISRSLPSRVVREQERASAGSMRFRPPACTTLAPGSTGSTGSLPDTASPGVARCLGKGCSLKRPSSPESQIGRPLLRPPALWKAAWPTTPAHSADSSWHGPWRWRCPRRLRQGCRRCGVGLGHRGGPEWRLSEVLRT